MSPSNDRPPNPNQPSPHLPGLTTYLTGHNPSTGKAIIQSTRPANWTTLDSHKIGFNVNYTTSNFPASLNSDTDISTHDNLMTSKTLGLVNPGGTVCRTVDTAPGHLSLMHRTQSLDYGIVLEGEVEMILDSGDRVVMKRGDVAVQRATMHAWRNTSETEWARMIFILQDVQKLSVGGKELKEDLAEGLEGLPKSGNDVVEGEGDGEKEG